MLSLKFSNIIMSEIDPNTYLFSKIERDLLSLRDKIDYLCQFVETTIMKKLKQCLHSNKQMSHDEYSNIFDFIHKLHDDIMITIQNEINFIKNYFVNGIIKSNELNITEAYTKYLEKRTEYFNIHEKVVKLWESSLHSERTRISSLVMKDSCTICCKKHSKNCTVILSCSHIFGIKCFNKWADVCIDNKTNVTCPICRALNV